jgi:hypothetical protein
MAQNENKSKMNNFIMYLFAFSSLLWLTVGIISKEKQLVYLGVGILNLLTATAFHPKVQKRIQAQREKREQR